MAESEDQISYANSLRQLIQLSISSKFSQAHDPLLLLPFQDNNTIKMNFTETVLNISPSIQEKQT